MRRIDARISSIEGSWTFAGCVISDSTSKPSYLHQAMGESPVPNLQAGFSSHQPDLSPDQARSMHRAGPRPHGDQRGCETQQHQPRIAQLTTPTVRHGYN
jgi:hypothetical protein